MLNKFMANKKSPKIALTIFYAYKLSFKNYHLYKVYHTGVNTLITI